MATFGYTLFCEGNDPRSLVSQAVMAEKAGFDFLVISDHYHPWLTSQSHAGFAWSILGAVAQATSRIKLATMVTCPIVRYHPVIVAQMAATVGVLSEGRFTLGLGAGERLNEHVVGKGWPAATQRHEMLSEAIDIIRLLWKGKYVTHQGKYYSVEDACVFDLPEQPIELFVAAGGPKAAELAAKVDGGICVTSPEKKIIQTFKDAGGNGEQTWGQLVLSWDATKDAGLKTAHEQFRFSAGGWKVQAELPNPVNFDAATKNVRHEDLADSIPSGPDAKEHIKGIQTYLDAGVEQLAVAYPGTDHAGFMRFWSKQVRPQL